jgi:uracil-DNA glycosylase family 4
MPIEKRRSFAQETYWGRPVPGFGDPEARIWIVGLAPAAHGANRTGRMFTGDRSGDFLYAALHRAGLASQAEARSRGDGLALRDVWIGAALRCAPPGNKPTPAERDRCLPFLAREIEALTRIRAIVALGGYAWDGVVRALGQLGHATRPKPAFGHDAEVALAGYTMIGCYHPSQQNTFTGRLTMPMMQAVMSRAASIGDRG